MTSSRASAASTPVMTSPVRGSAGYPGLASTTVTQASSQNTTGVSRRPVAASEQWTARSLARRGATTSHSGSPNRTLYSITFGPSGVSIRPAYNTPRYWMPSAASVASVGSTAASMIDPTTSADATGTGEYAPMPPVLGPVSPSAMRLKSCAGASGTPWTDPSHNTSKDNSGPVRPS